jgi:hypothetical protein
MVAACGIWCFGVQVVGMELRVVCPGTLSVIELRNYTSFYREKYSEVAKIHVLTHDDTFCFEVNCY